MIEYIYSMECVARGCGILGPPPPPPPPP
eukprot:SAG22_NODE_5419_length_1017_cov_1.250545_2_plen_28_part_01